jgi:hypothetical protein
VEFKAIIETFSGPRVLYRHQGPAFRASISDAMAIGVVVVLTGLVLLGGPYPSFYIQGGRGYKEGNLVGYNMIPIRTLSLLAYFTDIAIYALGSRPWSFGIFWMVG